MCLLLLQLLLLDVYVCAVSRRLSFGHGKQLPCIQKIFENFYGTQEREQELELKLEPPGTKVSCHGTKWPPQSAQKVSWRMKNFLQREWLGQKAFSLSCPWPKQWLSSSAVSANESRIVRLNVSGRLMDVLGPSFRPILILVLVLVLLLSQPAILHPQCLSLSLLHSLALDVVVDVA